MTSFALIVDSNGNGTGSHKWSDTASMVLAPNEVECTPAQAQNPLMYCVVNGVITESLPAAKAEQIALLQSSYKSAINAPVTFTNAAGVTSTYPSGDTILINGMRAKDLLAEVIAAGEAAWTLGKWIDTNNVAQTFTFADLQGLAAAMEAAVTTDWTDLVAKIAQVNAATTVAEVQSITF